jgi:hypothetical protein
VLAQKRRSLDVDLQVRELDRASGTIVEVPHPKLGSYLTVGSPIKFSDLKVDIKASPLHRQHRRARDVELAQDIDGLELGLVGQPILDDGDIPSSARI